MNKPISVGDLVMVVRGHSCVIQRSGGVPYRVRRLLTPFEAGWHCILCGAQNMAPNTAGANLEGVHSANSDAGYPLQWLKRIPPLDEMEREKRREDIREPA